MKFTVCAVAGFAPRCCLTPPFIFFHGLRWQIILRPIAKIPYVQSVIAIHVGLFTNEVFPLIERIFDGIWLMACFFITLKMGRLPGVLLKGGYSVAEMVRHAD